MNKIIVANLHQKNDHEFLIEDNFGEFHGFPDILAIQKITAVGTSKMIGNTLEFSLEVKCIIKMLAQSDLSEKDIPMNFKLDISFGDINKCDYPLENIIEMDPIIIGNILAEAPYSI